MKQTAVEWLGLYIKGITTLNCDDIIEQAKAMEKEQMNNAYNDDRPNLTIYESNEAFEQYYKETYESNT